MLPLVVFLLVPVYQVLAIPSAINLKSDLTFLFQNDLNWTTAADHKGTILVSRTGSKADALAACRELGETLLTADGPYFNTDIKSLLTYLSTNSRYNRQKFWVESTPDAPCSVISLPGSLQSVPCNSNFPAFCSQSAPYRRNTNVDPNPAFHVQVESKKLTVVGTRDHLSFRFLGIPYADPFERFTYSKPFSGVGTINALTYGSACTQPGSGSEDCLFLNIYTPYLPQNAARTKSLKPVMFWIHGGGFTGGAGDGSDTDGGNMVSRSDVVVVSINYRLGALGFLALEDGFTNGNFGIADQITALQWVREHIADFGGDPSLITIYGQSAGAGSVRALLAAPPAFGLFQGAIAQSNLGGFGYAATYSKYITIQQQYTSFAAPLIANVGCSGSSDVLACLRALPASTLIGAPNGPRYIVVDGRFITTDQLEVGGKGSAARVHVMFGWMRDDGSDFVGSYPTSSSTLTSALLGAGMSSDVVSRVVGSNLYTAPVGTNSLESLYNLTSRIGTDGQFRCIDQATLIAAAKHQVFPSVWAYQFDRSYAGYEPVPGTCNPPSTPAFPNGDPSQPYYRCHSGELYFMFGSLGQDSKPFRDSGDFLISQYAVDSWGSFARTQNPNPSPSFLASRGYTSTAKLLQQTGGWNKVTPREKQPLRIIDATPKNSGWFEEKQCELLGYPFNFYG